MKCWITTLFCNVLAILSLTLTGCTTLMQGFNQKFEQDSSLPTLSDIRTISDVSTIGFEWEMPAQKVDSQNVLKKLEVEGFVIYRAKESDFVREELEQQNLPFSAFKQIAILKNPLATHFFDTNLAPKSVYYYLFATLGKNKTMSPLSKTLKVETSFIDPIEGLFVLNHKPKTLKIVITPHANPSIKSYIIQRQNDKGVFINITELKGRFNIEYFDTNLQDDTAYTYRVLAKDFLGNLSEPSTEVSERTLELLPSVENASATHGLPLKIELSWNPLSQAKRYKIYADMENNGQYKVLATTTKTHFTHTLKEHGQSVRYQIVGLDSYEMDGKMLKTPLVGSTLARPQAPKITSSKIEGQNIIIQWSVPEDSRAKKYALYRKEPQTNRSNRYNNIKSTNFIDKETKRALNYTYSVSSIDEFGIESQQSASVTLMRN